MPQMKQRSLKHRKVLRLLQERLAWASKFFIPPDAAGEKTLKNRVQVLPKRKPWNRLGNHKDEGR
jgi:hypothetical protein